MGVGDAGRVADALPRLRAVAGRHVTTLERVSIVRRDGAAVGPLPVVPHQDEAGLGLWQRLTATGGARDGGGSTPFHVGLIRELRAAAAPRARPPCGARGATPPTTAATPTACWPCAAAPRCW